MKRAILYTAIGLSAICALLPLSSAYSEPSYAFSADWVSRNSPTWKKLLKEYEGKPNISVLEIGSFEGRSALWFLDNILTHPTSSITCIDVFETSYERVFDHNIKLSGNQKRVRKLKGMSHKVLRTLTANHYDIIYIDGCHKAACTLMDAVLSWDLLKIPGIVIFDDYATPHRMKAAPAHRPKIAVDSFIEAFLPYIEVLEVRSQQAVIRKLKSSDKKMNETAPYRYQGIVDGGLVSYWPHIAGHRLDMVVVKYTSSSYTYGSPV